jgi:hypothetical protein
MTRRMQDECIAWGIVACLFAGIIGLAILVASYKCQAKWELSGFTSSYGPWQGCLIRMANGVWIPAENYRDIP